MKLYGLALLAVIYSNSALADDAPIRKLFELMSEGYLVKATGVIVTRRELIEPLDEGIFVHRPPRPNFESCAGEFVVTMDGPVKGCRFRDLFVNKARYYRMSKGETEFVCIRSGGDICHLVH